MEFFRGAVNSASGYYLEFKFEKRCYQLAWERSIKDRLFLEQERLLF